MSDPTQPSSPSSLPPEPAQVSLTTEVDSISEVFDKAPLTWNDADMARIIDRYRKDRKVFDAEPEKAKRTAAAKVPVEDLKGISGADLLGKLGL